MFSVATVSYTHLDVYKRQALKVIYQAVEQAARKWTLPIQDWKRALNRFAIMFEDRLPL